MNTTAERGRGRAAPAVLVLLTTTAAVCSAAALVLADRHLLAACEGAAVPWPHFASAYAGVLAAAAVVAAYSVARVRAARGAATAAAGRAGLATAVCAGVVLLAGGLAVWSAHQQAAMARAHAEQNLLIACTSG